MNPVIIAQFMVGAAFTNVALFHFIVWLRERDEPQHFWFSLTTAAAAAVSFINASLYASTSIPMALDAYRLNVLFGGVWMIGLTWFVMEYSAADSFRRLLAKVVIATAISAVVYNFISPAGLVFTEITGLRETHVLGGRVAYPVGEMNPVRSIWAIASVLQMSLVIDASVRLWRSNQRRRSIILGATIAMFLVAFGIYAELLDRGVLDPPYLDPFIYLLVTAAVSYELASEMRRRKEEIITQRKDLANASRLAVVGELSASIAHEINQPLGAILSNIDTVEMMFDSPGLKRDDAKKILLDIHRDSLRASEVVKHVRSLARSRVFDMTSLDANQVVEETLRIMDGDMQRAGITLKAGSAAYQPLIRGDRVYLQQALVNFLCNAMDALADLAPGNKRSVVVNVTNVKHEGVEISISDTGGGIPDEHLSQLFTSFHTTKQHGMGLGLSISRSIIEAHGGRVQAENNAEVGATFRITLPGAH